jgi:DNA helicase-2/ATP-dependent DNA helicase PcrA
VNLLRVINTPPRGIGKTTLDLLEEEARKQGISLWEIIQVALEEKTLTPRTLHALSQFHDMIQGFVACLSSTPTSRLIQKIMEESGYMRWLEQEATEESLTRLDNLKELLNAARDSEMRHETLHDFLDHAALVSETDEYDERARVTLLTLHSAKGLEFGSVFIAGLEEGLFPHSRSLLSEQEMEEERRLCYVGMTRARRKLILTRARMRRYLGSESLSQTEPSRFLREIPAELIDHIGVPRMKKRTATYEGTTYNTPESILDFYRKRGIQVDLSSKRKEAPNRKPVLSYGTAVRHPKFGVGTVIKIEGEGEESKLTISFPGYGLKKMVKKYANLERL